LKENKRKNPAVKTKTVIILTMMEGNMEASSECPKKPSKGILKTSRSFDKSGASFRKSAKFDELNVLQTFHPADKDYGHMKIDEPKTPYNYASNDEHNEELDAELLAEKLRIAASTQNQSDHSEDSDDEHFNENPIEKEHRVEFERRRKAHYKEFEAVKLARKLIEEELKELEDDDNDDGMPNPNKSLNPTDGPAMDVDAQSSSSQ